MSTSELERRLGDRLHRQAEKAMNSTNTEEELDRLLEDTGRSVRRRRRTWVAGGLAAVAALAALVVWRPDLGTNKADPEPAARSAGPSRRRRRSSRHTAPSTGTGPRPTWPTTPPSTSGRTSRQRPLAARQPVAAGGGGPDPARQVRRAVDRGPRDVRVLRVRPARPRVRAARARAVPGQHVQPHRRRRRDRRCVDGAGVHGRTASTRRCGGLRAMGGPDPPRRRRGDVRRLPEVGPGLRDCPVDGAVAAARPGLRPGEGRAEPLVGVTVWAETR